MSKKLFPVYGKQLGITLLEVLVSIFIGSILIIAITSMYGNFIGANQMQKEQSNAQDQANFAFLSLDRAVRMAGAGLCVNPLIKSDTYLHQPLSFDERSDDLKKAYPQTLVDKDLAKLSTKSRIFSFEVTKDMKLGTSRELVPRSDALLVIYSDSRTRRITDTDTAASADETSLFNKRKLAENRSPDSDFVFNYDSKKNLKTTWVMISDCDHTGIFRYSPDKLNSEEDDILPTPDNGDFAYNFGGKGQNVLMAKLHAQLYFVAKNNHGNNTLYVKNLLSHNSDAQALASNVDSMIVEYKDGTWKRGTARTNWAKELPVRITLKLDAGRELETQSYTRILGLRN